MNCKQCQQYIPAPRIYIKAEEDLFPKRQTPGSAGFDLHSAVEQVFFPGQVYRIPTGVTVQMPKEFEGQLRARSSLAMNGLFLVTGTSTIDSDFRDEIEVPFMNATDQTVVINKGDRIAQMVFHRLPEIEVIQTVFIDTETDRKGGFGSTNTEE